ncbi:MAG: hypothetical protein P8N52_02600 [Crocinitomicaceae bacterium]|nr:hypothetical protein [Crocinitomicaceae bacterium]MDG1775843.1 hypothetical protein [Crocinitomicaceae bacterium]
MKISTLTISLLVTVSVFSQKSENLIPKAAASVFSINNVSLLQKISLDELIKYEFMEEVQAELFDGSTTGKTLKDSGIDFNQKLNVFYGKTENYEVAGLSFGVTNKEALFDVFDDFTPSYSDYSNVEFYESYFSRIAIEENSGVLFRVTPTNSTVDLITDSIWQAQGNEPHSYSYRSDFLFDQAEVEAVETEVFIDGVEVEDYPVAEETPSIKTYYELRDSIETGLSIQYLSTVCDEVFVDGQNLVNSSPAFAEQLTHTSEGVFFLDNSKGLKNSEFSYLKNIYPTLYSNIEALYTGNLILGDLVINDNSVEMQLNAQYGDELGSIYSKLSGAKFDKNVLKYIHKDNLAYFTYRVNLREAYEQAYDIIIPLLSEEEDLGISAQLLVVELMNEFLNKDAIFDTYKGSVFGTFNGIQKVKTNKITYHYDEETFEYTEEEVEAEADMPIFTLGFSTDRSDIPTRILELIAKLTDECHNEGAYWEIDRAVLDAAPLYILIQNDLFILTNDENLVKQNANGFGKEAISKKEAKAARKSGIVYGYADLGLAIGSLPRDIFSASENELIDVLRDKSGRITLNSTNSSQSNTSFNLIYDFDAQGDSDKYILDLINSMYILSK